MSGFGRIRLQAAKKVLAQYEPVPPGYRAALQQLGMRLHQNGALRTTLAENGKGEWGRVLMDVFSVCWEAGSAEHFGATTRPSRLEAFPDLLVELEERPLLEAEMLAAVGALRRILHARQGEGDQALDGGTTSDDLPDATNETMGAHDDSFS